MSADKHRNAEDRALVLRSLRRMDDPEFVDAGRVRGIFARRIEESGADCKGQRSRRGWRRFRPYSNPLGDNSYSLWRRCYRWLKKRGFIRVVSSGPRNDRDAQGRKSSARTHNEVKIVTPAPQPGRAKNERRGQTKPGGRR